MKNLDTTLLDALLEDAEAAGDPLITQLLHIAAALATRAAAPRRDQPLDALRMSVAQWIWARQLRAAEEDTPQPPDPAEQSLARWLDTPHADPVTQLASALPLLEALPQDAAPRALIPDLLAALETSPTPHAQLRGSRDRDAARDAARAALRLLNMSDLLDQLIT
jgi:hypothetical protein